MHPRFSKSFFAALSLHLFILQWYLQPIESGTQKSSRFLESKSKLKYEGPQKRQLISAGYDPFWESVYEKMTGTYPDEGNFTLVDSLIATVNNTVDSLLLNFEIQKLKNKAEKKAKTSMDKANAIKKETQKHADELYRDYEEAIMLDVTALNDSINEKKEQAEEALEEAKEIEKEQVKIAQKETDKAMREAKNLAKAPYKEAEKVKSDADSYRKKVVKVIDPILKQAQKEFDTAKKDVEKKKSAHEKEKASFEKADENYIKDPQSDLYQKQLDDAKISLKLAKYELDEAIEEYYIKEAELINVTGLYDQSIKLLDLQYQETVDKAFRYADHQNLTFYLDAKEISDKAFEEAQLIFEPAYKVANEMFTIYNDTKSQLEPKINALNDQLVVYKENVYEEALSVSRAALDEALLHVKMAEAELQLLIHSQTVAHMMGQSAPDELSGYEWSQEQIDWFSEMFGFDFSELLETTDDNSRDTSQKLPFANLTLGGLQDFI